MKKRIRQVLRTAKQGFLLWKRDVHIYASAVFVLTYLVIMERPFRQFAAAIGIATAPWLLPFLVYPGGLALLMLVVVVLFSREPFGNYLFPFVLIRIGRVNWIVGKLVYVLAASAVYSAFVSLSSMAVLFPYARWTDAWGTVIDSYFLSSVPYDMGYGSAIQCVAYVYFELSPLKAMLLTNLLFFLTTFLLGTVIVFGNLVAGRKIGVLLAALLICFSLIVDIASYISRAGDWLSYFSPVTWGSLNGVVLHDPGQFPHIRYALLMDGLICVALWMGTILRFRKQDITDTTGGMRRG